MAKQADLDRAYMNCAFAMAALSHAERKKVGAILVAADRHIIAEGVNGTPSGFDNTCEIIDTVDGSLRTLPHVLHAESNAIAKVAQSTNSSRDSTLYVTMSPCFDCAKLIIQAGIKRVVYGEAYRLTEGLDLLRKANITVDKLEDLSYHS